MWSTLRQFTPWIPKRLIFAGNDETLVPLLVNAFALF